MQLKGELIMRNSEACVPAKGMWLSGEQLKQVSEIIARFMPEASGAIEGDPHGVLNAMQALQLALAEEAEIQARLEDDRPTPALIVHTVERTDDDRIYIGVNQLFDVRLNKTYEGVVVDIFPWEDKDAGESLGSTYAFDHEVAVEEDELEAAAHGG